MLAKEIDARHGRHPKPSSQAGGAPGRHAEAQRLAVHRRAGAEPGDGEVLVKVLYISLDPAMRGWMNGASPTSRRSASAR